MSRMLPSSYDHKLKLSDGEKKLFNQFKKLGDEYVIIHSLGISQHRSKVFSEIDFVIICEHGIMCLEVKGGHVQRREGIWVFTNRYGKENLKKESPFEQSLSAMFALKDYMNKHLGTKDPVVKSCFACGVAFPDVPFTQKGPEIMGEIIFDSRRAPEELPKYINQVFNYWRNQIKTRHRFNCGKINQQQIEKVASLLRGDFGMVPPLTLKIKQTEEKMLALTREQVDRLSIASDNPRILLIGGAGTGKTLLSLEYAIRFALKGEKVLYLCFNNNICDYLQLVVATKSSYITDVIENLKIMTFHRFIIEQLQLGGFLPEEPDIKSGLYFEETLPEAFIDMCSCGHQKLLFDRLVVDEGQDLLRYQYMLCFEGIIKNGLAGGNWHIAYDPNQNIYNDELEDGLEMISNYSPVRLNLDTNCRNTKPVGIYNTLITGIPPARYFRVDGDNVKKDCYLNVADQRKKLIKAIRQLLGQGAQPGNICLLSKHRFSNSCLRGENMFEKISAFQDITDLSVRAHNPKSIKFSTIHSYKGLESPIVFVLDIDGFCDPSDIYLNYVALTRATTLLYLFYDIKAEEELQKMIRNSAILLKDIEDTNMG